MRYLLWLLLYITIQLFTYLITPVLPLFAVMREGPIDNGNGWAEEPRLPLWLSWFDTPDNSLHGDNNWVAKHEAGYFAMVGWLYRNSLYGFKWSVLAMPVQVGIEFRETYGDMRINHHTQVYGTFTILQLNGAWQYKVVQPLLGRTLVLNIGWLLDDTSKKLALFMFSPRLVKREKV